LEAQAFIKSHDVTFGSADPRQPFFGFGFSFSFSIFDIVP
jgi:hypothetical protein